MTCRSMRRFADADENGPPAIESVSPKKGELRLATGKPGFRELSRLRAMIEKVKL